MHCLRCFTSSTVDQEIFTLKIIRPLNFRVKIFHRSTVLQRSAYNLRVLIFHVFNFRCSACGRKHFNDENVPIYGISSAVNQVNYILLHFGNVMCFDHLQDPVDPQEACRGPRGRTTLYQIRFQIGSFRVTEIVNSSACGAERCSHTFSLLNVLSDSVPSSYDSVSVAAENVVGVGPARLCTTQTISELNSTMLVHRRTNTHTCEVSMCTF